VGDKGGGGGRKKNIKKEKKKRKETSPSERIERCRQNLQGFS
jgi:hypothetical protein